MTSLHSLPVSSPLLRFTYKGFPIHMKEYGRGLTQIPLVFIGSAFHNIKQIEKLSRAFSAKTWVITIDTPGNGDTGVLPHAYSFEFICNAIHHCLKEEMRVSRINLFGCGFGSVVAMRYAQKFPNIDRLVLGSAIDRLPQLMHQNMEHLLLLLDENKREQFADCFTNLVINPALRQTNSLCETASHKLRGFLSKANECLLQQFIHNTKRLLRDGTTDLEKMPDVVTTVFTGEHDTFVSVEDNMRVAAAFKRSQFIVLPDSDHMFHIQQHRLTVETILDAILSNAFYTSAA